MPLAIIVELVFLVGLGITTYILTKKNFFLLIYFILSYLLKPVIKALSIRYNISFKTSCVIVLSFISIVYFAIIVAFLPFLYKEILLLSQYIIENLPKISLNSIYSYLNKFNFIKYLDIENIFSEITQTILYNINNIAFIFNKYVFITIKFPLIILLSPIALFLILYNWPNLSLYIVELVPIRMRKYFGNTLSKIDKLLYSYFAGQFTVIIIFSIYYTLALLLVDLKFGIILGSLSGIMLLIPLIGFWVSFLICLLVSYLQSGINIDIAYISAIYLIGHISEAYFLTPKILGRKVGLHFSVVIIALFIFGNLLGIIGMVIAVPLTGIMKIILHNIVTLYKSSNFYKNEYNKSK